MGRSLPNSAELLSDAGQSKVAKSCGWTPALLRGAQRPGTRVRRGRQDYRSFMRYQLREGQGPACFEAVRQRFGHRGGAGPGAGHGRGAEAASGADRAGPAGTLRQPGVPERLSWRVPELPLWTPRISCCLSRTAALPASAPGCFRRSSRHGQRGDPGFYGSMPAADPYLPGAAATSPGPLWPGPPTRKSMRTGPTSAAF